MSDHRRRQTVAREDSSDRMRELMRTTGLSQHTIEAIRRGKRVRTATILRVTAVIGR
jgi:DNA-binding Xre family transcriptional regulator